MSIPANFALTGPPRIGYLDTEDPSGPAKVWLDLPHADTERFVQGTYEDATGWEEAYGGVFRLTVGPYSRPVFRLGYRYLPIETAELLIGVLKRRTVLFIPRTFNGAADDPSLTDSEEEFTCRVVSPVPFTKHLTLGFRITIELESLFPA